MKLIFKYALLSALVPAILLSFPALTFARKTPNSGVPAGWRPCQALPLSDALSVTSSSLAPNRASKPRSNAASTDTYAYDTESSGRPKMRVTRDQSAKKAPPSNAIVFREPTDHPVTPAMERLAAQQTGILAPLFAATDANGKEFKSITLTRTKPVILFFVELKCPCSRDAAPFLERIQTQFGDACTVVGVINAKPDEARAWAKQAGVKFTLLPDPGQKIIRSYNAERGIYATLVAPGGRIAKAYTGYSRDMLEDMFERIGGITRASVPLMSFSAAPKKLVSGCPFPEVK